MPIRTLSSPDAAALIATGDVDVIDVRSPDEWAEGHLAAARNVPLGDLQVDAKSRLPRSRVLFVCARGTRSLTAAALAEQVGLEEISSLEGGTQAWVQAGLPIVSPPPVAPAPRAAGPAVPATEEEAQLAEPALDLVVGTNLAKLREQRSLTLDALARMTGLSRTLLGQIELGKAAPSVGVVWKIARAFDVHFSALLATSEPEQTRIFRGAQAKRLVGPDGRFSSRPLYHPSEPLEAEFYELYLAAQSREDAQPHQPGTRENLIVTGGRVDIEVGGHRHELARGDAIAFSADVKHSYVNPGNEDSWMYLVMTYAQPTQ